MLRACWFQKCASVSFAFQLVAIYKPNANRGGYKSFTCLFVKNVGFWGFFFTVVFMAIVISGLVMCTAEVMKVMQDKTFVEL